MADKDKNEKDNLKKMMDAAQSSNDDSNLTEELKKSKKKKVKIWPWATGFSVLIVIIALIFLVPKFGNTQKVAKGTGNSETSVNASNSGAVTYTSGNIPFHMDKWQRLPYEDEVTGNGPTKSMRNRMITWADNNPQTSNALSAGFVSEKDGYTSNTKDSRLKDGKVNTKYSFLTAENVKFDYSSYVNRLINPQFGNWSLAQFAENDPKTLFILNHLHDMFTNQWWDNNIVPETDYSRLPIYADWNKNNYNHTKFQKGNQARWYGKLVSQNISPSSNNNGSFKNMKVKDLIKYSAIAPDGSIMNRYGVLKMTLVENTTNQQNPQHRLLINDAILTMKK